MIGKYIYLTHFEVQRKINCYDFVITVCDVYLLCTGQDGGKRMGLNFERVK